MNILYDGFVYYAQSVGGINRYFANLIDGLPEDFLPMMTIRDVPTVNWPGNSRLKILRPKRFPLGRISYKWEKSYFSRVTNSKRYDIFHPSYYQTLSDRSWETHKHPIVLTVYDMIHERFADTMDADGKMREQKRQAITAAQAILCISQNTKRDLIRYYSVPESKITVTYLAAELNEELSHGSEPVPSRPYLLYVGSRASYKNFDGLLQALSRVITDRSDIALCVVGSALTVEENQKIADFGLTSRIEHYGYASDTLLAKLYRCSLAFVYPSLYEGFGIPPLEAMQCGTPVIACDISSIPEVVGDAGLLFAPGKTDELADILRALVSGATNRAELIAKGRQRARQFTWQKTVDQTVEVYRALAS